MVKKYLNKLNFDEAREFVMDNEDLKYIINEDDFVAAKYNGTRLVKIAEDNELICKKVKENLNLDDD